MAQLGSTKIFGDLIATGTAKIPTIELDGTLITATAAELNYVDGVTSAIQTQLNAKAASSHTHGNITNAGAIGATANLMVKTTTSGVITTLAAGTTNQYLRGDGTWSTPTNPEALAEYSQEFTATEGQTLFTLSSGSYTPGSDRLTIFIWGLRQHNTAFTETSSTSFTLSAGVPAGTKVLAVWRVADPILKGDKGDAATVALGTVTTRAVGTGATVTNTGTSNAAIFNFGIPVGATGATGAAATIAVGTTTTGAAGSSATVSNSGTSGAAVFNFTIPRGDTGTAATVAVGTTTTGAAGTNASVTNSGNSSAAVFNFTIPRGNTGATGTAATIAVGTVTTLAAGATPTVTNSGTSSAAVFNFGIPAPTLTAGHGDTINPYASKTAKHFLAAPNAADGVPSFRAIVASDIPTLNQSTTGTAANVTGTVAIANGGTGATTAVAALTNLGAVPLAGGTMTGSLTTTGVTINATAAERHILFNLTGRNTYFYAQPAGTVGLWDSVSGGRWSTDTSNNFTAGGNITAYSDERLKSNIVTIPNALDKVTSLRGVEFDKDGKHNIGVIAQEVQKIIPEVVLEANDEMKTLSVAYGNMVGLLIEAIKEQQKQIDELKAKVM